VLSLHAGPGPPFSRYREGAVEPGAQDGSEAQDATNPWTANWRHWESGTAGAGGPVR